MLTRAALMPSLCLEGLLQHDYIEQFLVFFFAVSAHAQTRGTWTAAECIGGLDRDTEAASGYAAPAQTVVPTLIKWMMLFEDPARSVKITLSNR